MKVRQAAKVELPTSISLLPLLMEKARFRQSAPGQEDHAAGPALVDPSADCSIVIAESGLLASIR
jgi:hypothetical protein